jgi:tight adherence protein B
MIGVVAALLAGYGAFLVYTSAVFGWRGLRFGPPREGRRGRRTLRQRLDRAGLHDVRPAELFGSIALLGIVGATGSYLLFGAPLPTLVGGAFTATLPIASFRSRRARQEAAAAESWPRMLEELRLLTGSVGRSIPQALFDVGRRGPEPLRPAFAAAEREWLLTTDFDRTAQVLKERLADPTADTVCETLVVAHEVGGSGLDRRLAELVEDRILDVQGRKDAESQQAGVRFARRFVLIVPVGMALAGLSIGTGRAAYAAPSGQLAVVAGVVATAACWYWSGRLMRLPNEPRVFADDDGLRDDGLRDEVPAART